jgi:hypothetical protein
MAVRSSDALSTAAGYRSPSGAQALLLANTRGRTDAGHEPAVPSRRYSGTAIQLAFPDRYQAELASESPRRVSCDQIRFGLAATG